MNANYRLLAPPMTQFNQFYKFWVMACLFIIAVSNVLMIGTFFYIVYNVMPKKIEDITQSFEGILNQYVLQFENDIQTFITTIFGHLVQMFIEKT